MAADAPDLIALKAEFSPDELDEMQRLAPDMAPTEFLRNAAILMLATMEPPTEEDERESEGEEAVPSADTVLPVVALDEDVVALADRLVALETLVAEAVDVAWTTLSELYAHTGFPENEQGRALERSCRERAEAKISRIRDAIGRQRRTVSH